jgi:molybdopterin-containing oxidoreductase family membrane subunit
MMYNRQFGPYGPVYWALIFCNGLVPQFLWSSKVRHSIPALFVISLVVSVGMWLERFVIVATSLHRDFLPSSWGYYTPRIWDVLIYVGTIGQFIFLFFLFVRFVPMISIFEMRDLVYRRFGARGNTPEIADQPTELAETAVAYPTIEHH